MNANPINSRNVNLSGILAFVLLAAASQAHATGLGEIAVASAIGQPLNATIPLIETDASLSENCIDAVQPQDHGLYAPDHIQVSLEGSPKKGTAQLRLRTTKTVNEPVIGFAIRVECGTSLKREYIALIDPPRAETIRDAAPAVSPLAGSIKNSPPIAAAPSNPVIHAPRLRSHLDETSQQKRAHAGHQHAKPQLILSGNSHRHQMDGVLSLKLDTYLSTPAQAAAAAKAEVDLHDENTALQHKLDYLELQLASLQKRNTELETRLTHSAPPQPAHTVTTPAITWGLALLGLIIFGAGIAWLLHRKRVQQSIPDATESTLKHASRAALPTHAREHEPHHFDFHEPSSTEVNENLEDAVEVFVAHQHGDMAIQLLEEEIRIAPNASPTPWLLLLDLLHQQKKADHYETTRQACKRYYNLDMPAYGDILIFGKKGLEAFPHLIERLCKLWAQPDATSFLNTLLHDSRNGARTGFDLETFHEILFLRDMLKIRSTLIEPAGLDFSSVRGLHR